MEIRNQLKFTLALCLLVTGLSASGRLLRGDTQHVLERINDVPLSPKAPLTAKSGQAIVLTGWAFDSIANRPASGVEIEVRGKRFQAEYGITRPDVAKVFQNNSLEKSGYKVTIPKGSFGPGEYQVQLHIGAAGQPGYYLGRTFLLRIY